MGRSTSVPRSPSRTIRVAYLSAIALVAGFVIAGHIYSDLRLVDRKDLAEIINRSGRQRMLSQKIAKEFATFDQEGGPAALAESIEEWSASHELLRTRTFGDAEIVLRFEELESSYRAVEGMVRDRLGGGGAPTPEALAVFTQEEQRFLAGMDRIVSRYEQVSKAQTDEWRRTSRTLAAGALLILLLEVLFIFGPLTRRVSRQFVELERSREDLRRMNRDLESFSYTASHDLRSPLQAIRHLAGWIEEEAGDRLPEPSREHLATLISRSERMEAYLEGLRRYAMAGRDQHRSEEIDVGAVVDEVAAELAIPDSVRFERGSDPVTFTGRLTPFRGVLRSLILNAVVHRGKDEGRVAVRWVLHDDHLRVSIEDDGEGIPADEREAVFGLFKTLRSKDEVESTGVGLAIVKRVVESEGGAVLVRDSEDLGGARFDVVWPLEGALL